jgi:Zn-dependent peptidase ImmA (M78 family)/transcriptional regulator with XRE-family HTH domain
MKTTRESLQFVPGAVTVARTYRMLSVSELAAQANVSRQVVSSIENGTASPFPWAMAAIVAALRFPTEFFFEETATPEPGVLHFRKTARVRERSILRARSHAGLVARIVRASARFAKLPRVRIPAVEPGSEDSVERAAELFREALGMRLDTPIGNVFQAVEASGAFVATCDVGEIPIDGFCWVATAPLVLVNKAAPWSRGRHSALHEVGHVSLHGNASPVNAEEQAHRFAGAALAPRAVFYREFPRPRPRFDWAALVAMKQRWGMSLQALVRRAFDLRIIDAVEYRTANIHIRQYGWRIHEPGEMEPERPTRYAQLMAGLSERERIDSLAATARLSRGNIEEILDLPLEDHKSRIVPIEDVRRRRDELTASEERKVSPASDTHHEPP